LTIKEAKVVKVDKVAKEVKVETINAQIPHVLASTQLQLTKNHGIGTALAHTRMLHIRISI